MKVESCEAYARRLESAMKDFDWSPVTELGEALWKCWNDGNQFFLCGNGGSAANAVHLANDLLYGIDPDSGKGMRVEALPANTAVLTCLANDTSYAEIYSRQLDSKGRPGDVLLVFSGSGNSPNVVQAIEKAKELGIQSFAVLGFSGGKCLELADCPIHFPLDDMQVSEDLQMVVGHMLMKWLKEKRREESGLPTEAA